MSDEKLFKSFKVGVIGYSGNVEFEPILSLVPICITLGKELGKRYTVFTGGRDGVMELVSKSVREVGGLCVGVLPWDGRDANEYNSLVINTGLDFQMRSFILVKSVDVIVSIGGEIGTAIEVMAAYANRKPVILLRGTGGWSDRFAQILIDGMYLDNRKLAPIYQAKDVFEVLETIEKLATGGILQGE
ncbi:MAG: TIGR00725 family protein [Fervidobacterium sp.]